LRRTKDANTKIPESLGIGRYLLCLSLTRNFLLPRLIVPVCLSLNNHFERCERRPLQMVVDRSLHRVKLCVVLFRFDQRTCRVNILGRRFCLVLECAYRAI
jgi:hypothetical protein